MNQNSTAPTRNTIAVAFADAGALAAPCPFGAGGGAGLAAGVGGAADSLGGGGGQVIAPCLITVVPRITSSSMLTLIVPSFVLHSSSVRRTSFAAYRRLHCLASPPPRPAS